jgi:hypothetical protein
MSYHAERTGQITETNHESNSLKVHEVGDDGLPLCHNRIVPWHGREMVFTEQGPGEVTCGKCEHKTSVWTAH